MLRTRLYKAAIRYCDKKYTERCDDISFYYDWPGMQEECRKAANVWAGWAQWLERRANCGRTS